jgi:hypothetical protein
VDDLASLIEMDDSALIQWRKEVREKMERLPAAERAELAAVYDASTSEIEHRARMAWSKS